MASMINQWNDHWTHTLLLWKITAMEIPFEKWVWWWHLLFLYQSEREVRIEEQKSFTHITLFILVWHDLYFSQTCLIITNRTFWSENVSKWANKIFSSKCFFSKKTFLDEKFFGEKKLLGVNCPGSQNTMLKGKALEKKLFFEITSNFLQNIRHAFVYQKIKTEAKTDILKVKYAKNR